MTKIARMTPIIRRGTVIGKRAGGPLLSEAEHFHKCEACGGWFDVRDLGAVLDQRKIRRNSKTNQALGLLQADLRRAVYIRPCAIQFEIVVGAAAVKRAGVQAYLISTIKKTCLRSHLPA